MKLTFTLNGQGAEIEVVGDEMLQVVLRELGVSSSRLACGIGVCGVCTVLLDGETVASCVLPAALVQGCSVETIESVGDDDPVVQEFCSKRAFQCGFCTPGAILEARSLLEETPSPSREEIRERMAGNLCRCGCYVKIEEAVAAAAQHACSDSRTP